MAIALGVFMGIFPVWGYQMLAAAFFAHIFKLNKVITLLASNISIPPLMPFILFSSFYLGSLLLGTENQITLDQLPELANLGESILQYLIGSICLAALSAILAGSISFFSFEWIHKIRG